VFPAMGVMFALAGSLTVRSLTAAERPAPERRSRSAVAVVASRFRRLLPSVWIFGVVALLFSLGQGYGLSDLRHEFGLSALWWLVPLSTPPFVPSQLAWAFVGALWYVAVYLWLVLLTPALLRLFRSWPVWTLGVALALPAVLQLQILTVDGPVRAQIHDLSMYLACWILGIAHREGWLARVRARLFWSAVGALAFVAIAYLVAKGYTLATLNLHLVPVVNALWSAAVTATLLRLGSHERVSGLLARARSRRLLAATVRAMNARALTIYLWHMPSLLLAHWVANLEFTPRPQVWFIGAVTVAGTVFAALVFGWVEDLAARRPIALPWRVTDSRAAQRGGADSDGNRRRFRVRSTPPRTQ
jgi:peptidoglycan/LPS O-acetylase OafA/YrhL